MKSFAAFVLSFATSLSAFAGTVEPIDALSSNVLIPVREAFKAYKANNPLAHGGGMSLERNAFEIIDRQAEEALLPYMQKIIRLQAAVGAGESLEVTGIQQYRQSGQVYDAADGFRSESLGYDPSARASAYYDTFIESVRQAVSVFGVRLFRVQFEVSDYSEIATYEGLVLIDTRSNETLGVDQALYMGVRHLQPQD